MGSLLEVGTGFHPELTGREKRLLETAPSWGMTRARIDSAFDEIVDFAETEKFIDTPVKPLLQRDDGSARVRGGCPHGAGNPPDRRGPGCGRHCVPEEVPGAHE